MFTEQIEEFAEVAGGLQLGPLAATGSDDLTEGISLAQIRDTSQ